LIESFNKNLLAAKYELKFRTLIIMCAALYFVLWAAAFYQRRELLLGWRESK